MPPPFTPVAIVAACRTAVGAFGGSLKAFRAPQLASVAILGAIQQATARSNGAFTDAMVDDVRFGNCMEDVDGLNTARVAWLLAGLANTVPGATVNRVCVSGLEAIVTSAVAIQAGFLNVALAGGVETMSSAPYIVPSARWGARLQDTPMLDAITRALHAGSEFVRYPKDGPVEAYRGKPYIMGATAEFLAQKHGITREEQDLVALRSHAAAERATALGHFAAEIIPVPLPTRKPGPPAFFDKDEHFRPGVTLDQLAQLKPAFHPRGSVTAGNASGINDGASAVLLMSVERAEQLGLEPLGLITGFGRGACAPEYMGESPVPAVRDLLARTGRANCDHYDSIEVNEAFAAQYIAVERELGLSREITNISGSGIGLGHPVGSTGSRLVVTLLHEMQRNNKKIGMATLCGGGGVSLALEVQRP